MEHATNIVVASLEGAQVGHESLELLKLQALRAICIVFAKDVGRLRRVCLQSKVAQGRGELCNVDVAALVAVETTEDGLHVVAQVVCDRQRVGELGAGDEVHARFTRAAFERHAQPPTGHATRHERLEARRCALPRQAVHHGVQLRARVEVELAREVLVAHARRGGCAVHLADELTVAHQDRRHLLEDVIVDRALGRAEVVDAPRLRDPLS